MISFLNLDKVTVPERLNKLLVGSWHDRMTGRAIVLSYITARNMKIVRFPTRPDRVVDGQGSGYQDAALELDNMNDQKLESLAKELKQAYDATQLTLKSMCPNGFVTLHRSVAPIEKPGIYLGANRPCDPIELFALLAVAAKEENVEQVSLDFDIVSGWSQTKINRYGSVHIKREWAIQDVLLISDLTVGPDGMQMMESDEWLCVNRSPRGILSIAWSDFDVEGLPAEYRERLKARGANAALALQAELNAHLKKRTLAPRPSTNPFGTLDPIPKQPWWSRFTS